MIHKKAISVLTIIALFVEVAECDDMTPNPASTNNPTSLSVSTAVPVDANATISPPPTTNATSLKSGNKTSTNKTATTAPVDSIAKISPSQTISNDTSPEAEKTKDGNEALNVTVAALNGTNSPLKPGKNSTLGKRNRSMKQSLDPLFLMLSFFMVLEQLLC